MILSLNFHQDVFIKLSAPNMGERKREEVETQTEKDRQREYSGRPTADDYQIFFCSYSVRDCVMGAFCFGFLHSRRRWW